MDGLLRKIEEGIFMQGYSEAKGFQIGSIIVQRKSLRVNSSKVQLVPFTRRKELTGFFTSSTFGSQIQISNLVKYLKTLSLHLEGVLKKVAVSL